jgi:AcrR family transcriptional regulator
MAAIRYDERLERLLSTAARVFADKGFHATTMRDLARATGMSLAGMYYYVRGKDELLFVIQERCFQHVLAGAEAAIGETSGPHDRIIRFIHHHIDFFASHMSEMKVISHEARSLSGSRMEKVNRLKHRYVDLLAGLIAELESDDALSRSVAARTGRIDPRITAYALFGMMNWIYTWYHPKGPVSPERLADHFAQLFLTGATAPSAAVAQGGS